MGLFSFLKDAGAKVFGGGKSKEEELKEHCRKLGIDPEKFNVTFDEDGQVKTVAMVKTQAEKEKLVLALGNVQGVGGVDASKVEVSAAAKSAVTAADAGKDDAPEAEATFYTVQKGDTLSKIAKAQYGNANLYNKIFEANKPMLTHPDKIYPGQSLRIPPK
jgi:nucleoid-associated protein YgaU